GELTVEFKQPFDIIADLASTSKSATNENGSSGADHEVWLGGRGQLSNCDPLDCRLRRTTTALPRRSTTSSDRRCASAGEPEGFAASGHGDSSPSPVDPASR